MSNKRLVLACLLLMFAASCKKEPASQPLSNQPHLKALKYLFQQQSADGAWRSQTYNALSEGYALTPFVLTALSHLNEANLKPHAAPIQKALDFIIQNSDRIEATREYPTYSLSLTVLALTHFKPPRWEKVSLKLTGILRSWQLTEPAGWNPDDPEYGGWDTGGRPPTKANAMQVNISNTVFALAALRAAGIPPEDAVMEKARKFLERSQNPDGGFFYTTFAREHYQNKAGKEGDRYRSYGSATCDGALGLLACGAGPQDPRVSGARDWLKNNFTAEHTPGFSGQPGETWSKGLTYYYLYGLAKVCERSPVDPQWAQAIRDTLSKSQRPDGSWVNSVGLMKEDDPLIATTLALTAWGNLPR